jgi:FAD/FMN-containing dehydrogenase
VTGAGADSSVPAPSADGFHHPASEGELIELVKAAYREGWQLRVRGAAHSPCDAIYTDPAEQPNQTNVQAPPGGPNLNLMLDRYRGWRVRDEGRRLVEAEAGIHLGADPSDPTGTATVEASLLWQLATEKGWALQDTGGISHQTVSGFTATGSSGGSLHFSANRNLWGFRIIDGRGEVHEVTREDPDPDLFYAMCPNLGLLGIVSTITLECVETFNIEGQEATTTVETCRHLRRRRPGTTPAAGVPSGHRFLPPGVVAAARRRPSAHLAGPADRGRTGIRAQALHPVRRRPRNPTAPVRHPLHDHRQSR